EYGAGMRADSGQPDAGKKLLLGLWRNVVAHAASARAARTQFENGFGDVLITYEQELIEDRRQGTLKGEIVYPKSTILSEPILVLLARNTHPDQEAVVNAFVQFLWSEAGQRLFVEHGFRSVLEPLNAGATQFGKVADLFTIRDFGGWKSAKKDIIDGIWKKQV